jgi:hypothetical protein
MLITNGIKIIGCVLMLITVHPLAAYAVVGFGAAAYSPAKYGILTELLPPRQLVIANGWIEGTTVASIILGVLTGGALIGPRVATMLLGFNLPYIDTGIDTPPEAAISVIMLFYIIAAVFNWFIPNMGVDHRMVNRNPMFLIGSSRMRLAPVARQAGPGLSSRPRCSGARAHAHSSDRLGGNGARPQPASVVLQGVVAAGIAAGAVIAARTYRAWRGWVLPIGVTMGLIVISMIFVKDVTWRWSRWSPSARARIFRGR